MASGNKASLTLCVNPVGDCRMNGRPALETTTDAGAQAGRTIARGPTGRMSAPRWHRRLRYICNFLLGLILLGLAAWLAIPLVPLPPALFDPSGSVALETPSVSLEFLDKEGRTLRETTDARNYFSKRVGYGEVPDSLVQATLAAEDKRFWRHPGIDWRGTARAVLSLAWNRRVVSGGSTITQQLIKMAAPRPRTLRTKIIEAAQALRLEQIWSKERILTEYLNRLDYGNLRAGCAGASEYYFRKPIRDLSVAEAALLAGLPQAPSRLNPQSHFERARKRQQWILRRMFEEGILPEAEYARAAEEPLRLAPPGRAFQAPHFVDLVLRRLKAGKKPGSADDSASEPASDFTLDAPGRARREIQTTLELPLNQFAERTLREQLARLDAHLNGAVVVIENHTGNVLALVGSENYFAPGAGQVNGAWAPRSAGSTLKPFTYLLAFERGATPATVVADVPAEFSTSTGIFRPVNYNHRSYGPMRYRMALASSLNVSAVKVLASIGGAPVLQERLQACGLTTLEQPPEFYGLGLTIGNAETRLLELANAYACLARLGRFKPCRLLVAEEEPGDSRNERQVFNPEAAYLIADILSDNSARTLAFGAESDLRFDFPVACKTGTSSDFRDNWAIGYTPEFTVGVWVGRFDGAPSQHISGVTGAAPILHELFERLHQRPGTSWYERPVSIVERPIHAITGKLITGAPTGSILEKFIADHLPAAQTAEDFDAAGRVRLSLEYHAWFATGDNWLAKRAVLESSGESPVPFSIVSPLPGTTYYLDPDLPASSRRISLKMEGSGACSWESDSLRCEGRGGEAFATLVEGNHRLRARKADGGAAVETWIVVKAL